MWFLLQVGIHQKFEDEVDYLNTIIAHGCAYVLGDLESEQWYLYTMDNHAQTATTTTSDDVTL